MAERRLHEILRQRLREVRDGYDRKPSDLKDLYLLLKKRPDYRQPHIRVKLGPRQHDWLIGLEEYGDDNGWLAEEARRHRERKERVNV